MAAVASSAVSYQTRLYQASWVATTAVLTAASYENFYLFIGSACVTTIGNTLLYNREVCQLRTSDNLLKNWAAVASMVMSSAVTALVLSTPPDFIIGLKALKYRYPDIALSQLMILPLVVGYGIPIAKTLYDRGKELLEKADFAPMTFYRSQTPEYKSLVSLFLDKCAFFTAILAPEALDYLPVFGRVQVMTLPFCSPDRVHEIVMKLDALLEKYPPAQIRLLWDTAVSYVLIHQQKWDLLPTLIEKSRLLFPDVQGDLFPAEVQLRIDTKKHELTHQYDAKIADFKSRIENLEKGLKNNPRDEHQLDQNGRALLKEIRDYYTAVKIFCPDLPPQGLKNCLEKLQAGEIQTELQAIRSRQNAAQPFDAEQDTFDYFVSRPERGERNLPIYTSYRKLLSILGIPWQDDLSLTSEPLNQALQRAGIATMGDFVQKVLQGNANLLEPPLTALNRLEIYLQDDRNALYRKIAGQATVKANQFVFLVSRVVYLATMTLAALTPIYMNPKLTAAGLAVSIPYYLSPSLQDTLGLPLVFFTNPFEFYWRTVTRRPFFGLFRGHPALMDTYDNATLLGKLRILGTELLYANALMQDDRIAGFATGGSMGREIMERYRPQNVRRQFFI